jgi:hypothetical protein
MLLLAAGCSALLPAPVYRATCVDWPSMTDGQQIDLATTIVDAQGLLERVRMVQHRELGVSKDALIQNVVGSVTKNCEVMHEPNRRVEDLILRLYGSAGGIHDLV